MTEGDVILLPPTAEKLIQEVMQSLDKAGHTVTVSEVEVVHTKMICITVHGKRKGEGKIAADVKRRKA